MGRGALGAPADRMSARAPERRAFPRSVGAHWSASSALLSEQAGFTVPITAGANTERVRYQACLCLQSFTLYVVVR